MTYETNYLAHHGILGQKWGVRRFQNPDGSLTPAGKSRYENQLNKYDAKAKMYDARASRARTTFGKNINATKAEQYRGHIANAKNFKEAKGVYNKIQAAVGDKRRATDLETASRIHERRAENAKTKRGTRVETQRAHNAKYMSEYYDAGSKIGIGQKLVEAYIVDGRYMNVPYERLSGRTTTRGKEALDAAFTLGIGGLILDAKYLNDQKKSEKS